MAVASIIPSTQLGAGMISCSIAKLCREIGEHQAVLPSLCLEMKQEKRTLDEIGEEKIKIMMERLGQFAATEVSFRALKKDSALATLPEVVQVWTAQLDCSEPSLSDCTRQGNNLFEGVLKRVGSLYHQTLMKLEEFRKSRSSQTHEAFVTTSKTFCQWATKLPSKPYDFVNPHMSKKALELLNSSQFFPFLLSSKNRTLRILDKPNAPLDAIRDLWKELPQEMQQAIDREICKYLPEAQGKEETWFNDKRFYHSNEFRLAYIDALRASLLKKHPNLSKEDYCTLLYKCALGNEFSDPIEWVKQELPYLEALLPEVDRIYSGQKPAQ